MNVVPSDVLFKLEIKALELKTKLIRSPKKRYLSFKLEEIAVSMYISVFLTKACFCDVEKPCLRADIFKDGTGICGSLFPVK